jgi:hypothetical protein
MDNIDGDDYKPNVFSESIQCDAKEEQDLIHLTVPNSSSKESRMQIIRKMMEEMLKDDVDDTFKDVFSAVTDTFDNYESIDKEMVERLKNIFSNDLVKKEKFSDIVKAIGQGSTVVYFKSAQLFKVYKKTELETLLGGQIRTIYKQLNESYEVVPNDSKQKIIILGDVSLADSIERIKTYIVSFMIREGIEDFIDSDIVCYKGKESIEIIINDYYVENQTEHDEIVKKLLKYIFQQEKNTKIVQKINTNPFSEFDGVKMVSMPSEKQLLATEYIEPLLTMISNVTQCSGFKNQINLSVTIHDHSVNTTNNNNIVNEPMDQISVNIYEFIKHIRDDKPEWYKESTWIKKDILLEKYNELYEPVHKRSFDIMFRNKLYISEKRKMVDKVRYMFVELFKISEL